MPAAAQTIVYIVSGVCKDKHHYCVLFWTAMKVKLTLQSISMYPIANVLYIYIYCKDFERLFNLQQ